MKRFYVGLLGFDVEWEPDADNVYLSSGIDNLALHRSAQSAQLFSPAAASSRRRAKPPVVARSSRADRPNARTMWIAWAAFLESRGVTIDAKPRTHRDGARSCYFKDPDGNSIQIIHHPPISDKL